MTNNLPAILLRQRLKKEMTQEAVADAIGKGLRTYQYYETGETVPRSDTLLKLSQLLEVDLKEIYDDAKKLHKPYIEERRDNKLNDTEEEIPVYQLGTRNGLITVYDDDPKETSIGSLNPSIFPGCNHAEKVTGDSMYPMIMNQAIVVGDRIKEFRGIVSGERYVVHTKYGLRTCKYVHVDKQPDKIKLVALNKNIPPQTIELNDVSLLMRVYFIINPA